MMKAFLALSLIIVLDCSIALDYSIGQNDEIDDFDKKTQFNEDEFLEYFGLPAIDDPEEKARREMTLKEAEKEVLDVNEKYRRGELSWWEEINEFADIPEDEFIRHHTGLINGDHEDMYDEESERHFASLRFKRDALPATYDSVKEGIVSPVKAQLQCGSCVAFATMAVVETCFKKITGVFGDYAEQQIIDCAYRNYGANGCKGAYSGAYLDWATETNATLSHESNYPYLAAETDYTCKNTAPYNQGARVTDKYITGRGDEDLLKKLVYEHGAVIANVRANHAFELYGGGIFSGCSSTYTNHAVAVVGYGSENGKDYWLIKNSWGTRWGEKGFMKLERGVGMCGIGRFMAVAKCAKQEGPTSEPITCYDKLDKCDELALTECWKEEVKSSCPSACGLCPGMTPVSSNTCFNKWDECEEKAATGCYKNWMKSSCKKACGLCEGMTPVSSNTCFNKWTDCEELAKTECHREKYKAECSKACGLCPGMTPVSSNTCFNEWGNCEQLAEKGYCNWNWMKSDCGKACGLCN